jgi:hypothetical protein
MRIIGRELLEAVEESRWKERTRMMNAMMMPQRCMNAGCK